MKSITPFKDITLQLTAGSLDLRSPDGNVSAVDYRLVYNFSLNEQKGRCRRGGWKQLFRDSDFGFLNQDFHDQLVGCQSYYQAFEAHYFGLGGLIGYDYEEVYPGYTVDGFTRSFDINMIYCGYAPNYYSLYPQSEPVSGPWMSFSALGYPYPPYKTPVNAPFCNTGSPFFYGTPYFELSNAIFFNPVVVPTFEYGPLGVYMDPYDYTTSYCGTQAYVHPGCRESLTLLGQITSEEGSRKLVVGTKSKLAVLNERQGNWRLIADGLGGTYAGSDCDCSPLRFTMDTLGGFAFFTNNFDPVLSWRFDAPAGGCAIWAAEYISDLTDLGITSAKALVTWEGFLLIANVTQDGIRRPFRIFWSDFNDPLSFIPGTESLAGFTDLGADEEILAMVKMGGSLRIYTNRAIYAPTLVGGTEVIHIGEPIYRGQRVLKYAHGIVNDGATHYIMGESTIYALGEFDREPKIVEWIHKAAGAIYNGVRDNWLDSFAGLSPFGPINAQACDMAIGWYTEKTGEVFFSWPSQGQVCNDKTLCINTQYGGPDIIDHGFDAGLEFNPDSKLTVAEWLIQNGVCGWSDFASDMVKEGEPYSTASPSVVPPMSFINATEDPSLPIDPDSFAARVCNITVDDLCRDCNVETVHIMASALDKTLKEYDQTIGYRERFVDFGVTLPCPQTVVGEYVRDGYVSLIQRDSFTYGKAVEKLINKVQVDFDAEPQTTPNSLFYQVGYGANPRCLIWDAIQAKPLECQTAKTNAQHVANNTRPNLFALFKPYRKGKYLAYRLFITGTGGLSCLERVTESLRLSQGEWK